MIDIVSMRELQRRPADLEAMYRLRYRVFKERLGWQVKTIKGMERDDFDDINPYYLLAYDDSETVVGTWRFLPTTGPYMLRDVFPQLLDGTPPPHCPKIWEGSRFAVDCESATRQGMGTPGKYTGEIFCAVVEFALAFGLSEVVTVYDARVARLLPRIGCHPKWQGRRHAIGSTVTLAGRFDTNVEALERIREANAIVGSVVRTAPWRTARTAA